MTRKNTSFDVLVIGHHPASYLLAAMLKSNDARLGVVHVTPPGNTPADRIVLINPAWFDLSPLLAPLRRKLVTHGTYGMTFLGDTPEQHSEFRSKSTIVCTADLSDVRAAMVNVARSVDVHLLKPDALTINTVDETGAGFRADAFLSHAKAVVVTDLPAVHERRVLGIADASWERGVLRRYSFVRYPRTTDPDTLRPLLTMSLDLKGKLGWAWMIPHGREVQLAVEQSVEPGATTDATALMRQWVDVLQAHHALPPGLKMDRARVESVDLPAAGALTTEGVADRTLVIGPAGGFFSATLEDLYPNSWSAVFAADVLCKALKERHLQDALQSFQHTWRTTLGDYLLGPQQNLRYLLPLVYRNAVMTSRLAESILLGKNMIR